MNQGVPTIHCCLFEPNVSSDCQMTNRKHNLGIDSPEQDKGSHRHLAQHRKGLPQAHIYLCKSSDLSIFEIASQRANLCAGLVAGRGGPSSLSFRHALWSVRAARAHGKVRESERWTRQAP